MSSYTFECIINTLTISGQLAQYWAKQPAPTIHKEVAVFLRVGYPLSKEEYITPQGPGVGFEGSEGVHKLIGVLRDSWAQKQLLTTGRPAGEGEISQTIGLMRRRLSTAIVKANISVLLGRLGMVGEGAAMARGRRQWSSFEDEEGEGGSLEGGDHRPRGGEERPLLVGEINPFHNFQDENDQG